MVVVGLVSIFFPGLTDFQVAAVKRAHECAHTHLGKFLFFVHGTLPQWLVQLKAHRGNISRSMQGVLPSSWQWCPRWKQHCEFVSPWLVYSLKKGKKRIEFMSFFKCFTKLEVLQQCSRRKEIQDSFSLSHLPSQQVKNLTFLQIRSPAITT